MDRNLFGGTESERNRSGQVRQGVLVFPANNRKHHGRCYFAWSSLVAFVFPRLTCVFKLFFLSRPLFIVMGLPRSSEPMDAASPVVNVTCMEIDRLLMVARDIVVPKLRTLLLLWL